VAAPSCSRASPRRSPRGSRTSSELRCAHERRSRPRGGSASRRLAIAAAGAGLSEQGAGPLAVALVDHVPEAPAAALDVGGVAEIVLVRSPCRHFEAHVAQAALEGLIEARRPAVVLAG